MYLFGLQRSSGELAVDSFSVNYPSVLVGINKSTIIAIRTIIMNIDNLVDSTVYFSTVLL